MGMAGDSDWACIQRHRNGDPEAMREVVERYRKPLAAFIFNRTRDPQAVDDLFQETWFKALGKLDRYRSENFPAWLLRIARNLVIDRARRFRPERSLDEEGAQGCLIETLADSAQADPRTCLEYSDFSRALQAAVARLPDDQREVFVLRVQGEVPFKTIAELQGTSINTALARMQYALEKLRRELDDYRKERSV